MKLSSRPKSIDDIFNVAEAMEYYFTNDGGILLLSGPPGTGKSISIDLLCKEYGYTQIFLESPVDEEFLRQSVNSLDIFMEKKIFVVDSEISKNDVDTLLKIDWKRSKLVIITNYNRDYEKRLKSLDDVTVVHYSAIRPEKIIQTLSLYSIELGVSIPYNVLETIAKSAEGDIRAARNSLYMLVKSGNIKYLLYYLPIGTKNYYSLFLALFSQNREDVKMAIKELGVHLCVKVLRDNIYDLPKKEQGKWKNVIQSLSTNIPDMSLMIDAFVVFNGMYGSRSHKHYRKGKKIDIPEIDDEISDGKKLLYYRRVE